MATILYLDVDDEITSAAARMRSADQGPVAVVVPYGSRVATSRINFRLLAREAQARGRTLAIVAGDAATRALAASAGLSVFSSVGEYEASLAGPGGGSAGVGPAGGSAAARRGGEPAGDGVAAAAAGAALAGETVVAPVVPADVADRPLPPPPTTRDAATATYERRGAGSIPVARGRSRRPSTPALVGVAILALAVLAAGVAAYVFLPSATITITPREEPLRPLTLTLRADPTVASPDPSTDTVPAQQLSFDVSASDTFKATGSRVQETNAKGTVTFRSKDFTSTNTIRAGSIVGTPSGVRFRTTATIVIPKAGLVGLTIVPSEADVGIEAVDPGPAGNVAANAITLIPAGEDPLFTDVRNQQPTSGGTHQEFPKVLQADVDAALAQLHKAVQDQFAAKIADPASVPKGTTVFPETAQLGDATPTVDPTTIVGSEAETFDLGLNATGTVTAVDEHPLEAIATARIRDRVDPGHRLVDGSIDVSVGSPTVDGAAVEFPVTATAREVAILDRSALLARVKGLSIPQARAALEPYGQVAIDVWPHWVTAIPTLDARVNLTIADAVSPTPSGGPSDRPSSSVEASPRASAAGSATPGRSGSPAPSRKPSASASTAP